MEGRLKLAFPLVAMAVFAVAAQQRQLTLKGKDGSFVVRNYSSFSVEQDPKKPNAFSFTMKGSPLHATIERQKLEIRANSIVGRAERSAGQELLLENATLQGAVQVVARRPSKAGGTLEQTVTVDASTATYTQDLEKLVAAGGVTLVQNDAAASQTFRITGSQGTIILYPPGQAPNARRAIRSLTLDGPVNFELRSRREVEAGTPPKRTLEPFTVRGKCQDLTYDDASRKLTLIQNVDVDGNDPLFLFTSSASRVVITLDDRGNPIRIEGDGEPGTTTAIDKPRGGR
jgi:hypothetical protein